MSKHQQESDQEPGHTGHSGQASSADVRNSVLRTLLYYDVFEHPLTLDEIVRFSDLRGLDKEKAGRALRELQAEGLAGEHEGYYFTGAEDGKIGRRKKANQLASKRMGKAYFFTRIIATAPYVRGVFISGSLSKGVMWEDSDIDFFIVTKPGKLWLTRTMLTFFRRVFLFNSHKNFCINYFVDENNLSIPDRNRFTATEIASLLPVSGPEHMERFLETNPWFRKYYPNQEKGDFKYVEGYRRFRNFLELLFDNRLGHWLNTLAYKLSTWFWRRKYSWLDEKTFHENLQSGEGLSKLHPNRQQHRVMDAYLQRVDAMEEVTGWSIRNENLVT